MLEHRALRLSPSVISFSPSTNKEGCNFQKRSRGCMVNGLTGPPQFTERRSFAQRGGAGAGPSRVGFVKRPTACVKVLAFLSLILIPLTTSDQPSSERFRFDLSVARTTQAHATWMIKTAHRSTWAIPTRQVTTWSLR